MEELVATVFKALAFVLLVMVPILYVVIRMEQKDRKERDARKWLYVAYVNNGLYGNISVKSPMPKTEEDLDKLYVLVGEKVTGEVVTSVDKLRRRLTFQNIIELDTTPNPLTK